MTDQSNRTQTKDTAQTETIVAPLTADNSTVRASSDKITADATTYNIPKISEK